MYSVRPQGPPFPPPIQFRGFVYPGDQNDSPSAYHGAQQESLNKQKIYASLLDENRNSYICMGLVMLCMMSLIPVWNAFKMLLDPLIMYMVGISIPAWILGICFGVLLVYLVIMWVFFRCTSAENKNEQTMFTIANVFVLLFGSMLLILSIPLESRTQYLSSQIFHKCTSAPPMVQLFQESSLLINLRVQSSCIEQASVETCTGYRQTSTSLLLKEMENRYKCSGICFGSATTHNSTIEAILRSASNSSKVNSSISLLGRPRAMQHRSIAQRLGASMEQTQLSLGSYRDVSSRSWLINLAKADAEMQASEGVTAEIVLPYPPTLFSAGNFQASCDGMAARTLSHFGGDVARELSIHGLFLVTVSIVAASVKLVSICRKGSKHMHRKSMQQLPAGMDRSFAPQGAVL